MKRIMVLLVMVLVLVAQLELPGCGKREKAKKPQSTKKVERSAETKPSLDVESLLRDDNKDDDLE